MIRCPWIIIGENNVGQHFMGTRDAIKSDAHDLIMIEITLGVQGLPCLHARRNASQGRRKHFSMPSETQSQRLLRVM